jgi:four helix bundle protein
MNEFGVAMEERTMRFALRVARFCRTLGDTFDAQHVARQLFRCATGAASNYRAARRGRSHREFTAKLGVVLEEADESEFWLVFASRSEISAGPELDELLREAKELVAIFTASVRTASGSREGGEGSRKRESIKRETQI